MLHGLTTATRNRYLGIAGALQMFCTDKLLRKYSQPRSNHCMGGAALRNLFLCQRFAYKNLPSDEVS
jgi:hypothetical protein